MAPALWREDNLTKLHHLPTDHDCIATVTWLPYYHCMLAVLHCESTYISNMVTSIAILEQELSTKRCNIVPHDCSG